MENLYFNEDVFNSYRDYVLGGFVVDENETIDFNTITYKIEEKISNLLIQYYQQTNAIALKNNTEITFEDAMGNACLLFFDYFGYFPKYFTDVEIFTQEIMNCDFMKQWLYEIIQPRIDMINFVTNGETASKIPNKKWDSSKNKNLVIISKIAYKIKFLIWNFKH